MKISIITINFNNLEGLKKTVDSVINQTYKNIEYIIIDGASTDGSAEYIKEQKQNFNYWVSEPDKGIYNAMNKGIDHATGDYLLFLNSGDYLADDNVIKKFVGFDPVEDIVYGDIYRENSDNLILTNSKVNLDFLCNSALPHQAMFFSIKLFSKFGNYDDDLKIVSDWKFYFPLFYNGLISYKKLDLGISVFDMSGISFNSNYFELIENERKIVMKAVLPKIVIEQVEEYNRINSKHKDLLLSRPVKIGMFISAFYKKIKNKIK